MHVCSLLEPKCQVIKNWNINKGGKVLVTCKCVYVIRLWNCELHPLLVIIHSYELYIADGPSSIKTTPSFSYFLSMFSSEVLEHVWQCEQQMMLSIQTCEQYNSDAACVLETLKNGGELVTLGSIGEIKVVS